MKVSGLCALFHTSLERVKRDSFSPYPFTLRAKQKTKQKYKKHCHCRFPFSLRVQTFAVDALYISLSRSSESLYLEAFPIFKTKEKLKWKKKKIFYNLLKITAFACCNISCLVFHFDLPKCITTAAATSVRISSRATWCCPSRSIHNIIYTWTLLCIQLLLCYDFDY